MPEGVKQVAYAAGDPMDDAEAETREEAKRLLRVKKDAIVFRATVPKCQDFIGTNHPASLLIGCRSNMRYGQRRMLSRG